VKEENLEAAKAEKLKEEFLFAEREPLHHEVLSLIEGQQPGSSNLKEWPTAS